MTSQFSQYTKVTYLKVVSKNILDQPNPSCLFQLLDEVQSYILVERSIKHNNAAVADSMAPEFLYMVSGFIPLLLSCILLM